MSKTPRLGSAPTWARNIAGREADFDVDCTAGIQPDFAPRLPVRVIPVSHQNSLSAATVRDVIDRTQRIVTYAAYEVVNGIRPDFADLRSVDEPIVRYATLQIEPFEEGSFVIPTVLKESPTRILSRGTEREFTGSQIVQRFAEAMCTAGEQGANASIGLVQSIESLGAILRREVERIEYFPIGLPNMADHCQKITVDSAYINRVTETRKQRQDPEVIADHLIGTLTAVDLSTGKLKLSVNGQTINGTFSLFMTDLLVESLRKSIRLEGVVEYHNQVPRYIRAFFAEPVER